MTPPCPPREFLSDFVQGRLDVPALDEVSAHVEDCTVCQRTLSELSNTVNSLEGKLRQAAAEKTAAPPAGEKSTAESRSTNPPPAWRDLQAALLKIDLATAAEVDALAKQFDAEHQNDAVEKAIRELVHRRKLTKFQAQVVFQGKAAALVYGDYLVQDKLGAGGMGQVYLAVHRKMRRQVALKVLPSSALKNAEAVKRFEREVEAAAKLVHPNIVIAHDASEQRGTWYLVMEYVAGRDLSKLVKDRGPLPVAEAVGYIAQAARGLAFAHAHGVIHRDIKPGNLLVNDEGIIKILDMGLARLAAAPGDAASPEQGELTHSGQVMGTVDYMAPEQAVDTSKADAKADVYSLGCSLYRLLTNQPLYTGNTLVEKILAHRERPIPSLCVARPDVPPALDALFQGLVAKKPEDRPTAAEAVSQLETVLTAPGMPTIAVEVQQPTSAHAGSAPLALVRGGEGRGARGPEAERAAPELSAAPAAGRGANKKPPLTWIAACTAGFLLVCFGVWFIFRDKDGNETARVQMAVGGGVSIKAVPPITSSAAKPVASVPASSASPTRITIVDPPLTPPTFLPPTKPTSLAPSTSSPPSTTSNPPAPRTISPEPPRAIAPFDAAQARTHQEAWAKYLGTTVETTNSVGMKMVLIPPGEYMMGISAEEAQDLARRLKQPQAHEHFENSSPLHRVELTQGFLIGATEVTYRQFKPFAEASKLFTEEERKSLPVEAPFRYWRLPEYLVSEDSAVVLLDWSEAAQFCNWLSEREGLPKAYDVGADGVWKLTSNATGYQLPTEAQWEFACRAGTTTHYSFGDDPDDFRWYATRNQGQAVASLRPNAFGLHDMHANVFEWCNDWYADDYYKGSPKVDPAGPLTGSRRANRGGSWFNGLHTDSSAWRHYNRPEVRTGSDGLRIVRRLTSSRKPSEVNVEPLVSPPTTATVSIAPLPAVTGTSNPFAPESTGTVSVRPATSAPPRAVAPFDAKQARAHQETWAKYLGTTVETTNSVGMKMVLIPPGEFLMGSTSEEVAAVKKYAFDTKTNWGAGDAEIELPKHGVKLDRPYLFGATEVSIEQFKAFVDATGYQTDAERLGFGNSNKTMIDDRTNENNKGLTWRRPWPRQTEDSPLNCPVSQITWNDGVRFCNWLSQRENLQPCYQSDADKNWQHQSGNGYRLPTEAEWEFACRAGTTTQRYFGDDLEPSDKYGSQNRDETIGTGTPNPFGIFQLYASKAERCGDFISSYSGTTVSDPQGPEQGLDRVGRGGTYRFVSNRWRSAARFGIDPNQRTDVLGLRVVRFVDPPKAVVSIVVDPSITSSLPTSPQSSNIDSASLADALLKSLAATKPLYVDECNGPSGPLPTQVRKPDAEISTEVSYGDGVLRYKHWKPKSNGLIHTPSGSLPRGLTNFVCEVRGRLILPGTWGVFFANHSNRSRPQDFGVVLDRYQKFVICKIWGTHEGPTGFPLISHEAIKPTGEWNTMTIVVWNRRLSLFINGKYAASTDIVNVQFPVDVALRAGGLREMHVEFDRIAIWGAEAIPEAVKPILAKLLTLRPATEGPAGAAGAPPDDEEMSAPEQAEVPSPKSAASTPSGTVPAEPVTAPAVPVVPSTAITGTSNPFAPKPKGTIPTKPATTSPPVAPKPSGTIALPVQVAQKPIPAATPSPSSPPPVTAVSVRMTTLTRPALTLVAHKNDVNGVVFHPRGGSLVTCGGDAVFILWDAVTGRELGRFTQGMNGRDAIFDRTGNLLLSASAGSTARVTVKNMTTQAEIMLPGAGSGTFHAVEFLGGRWIVAGSGDGALRLWDLNIAAAKAAAKAAYSGPDPEILPPVSLSTPILSLAADPSGSLVAVGCGDGKVLLFNLNQNRLQPSTVQIAGHSRATNAVRFTPDGKTLISASRDGTVQFWDTKGAKERTIDACPAGVQSLAISSDGKLLATGHLDNQAAVWDLSSGTKLAVIDGHTAPVQDVAFSPDGRRLATAGRDFIAKVWDISGAKPKP
jgi:formylglycine-generating enzyme required for sulfatase activity/WD40 repeat protein